jgi:malic enzyme
MPDARRLSARIAVSLVLAVFDYLGLLLGGNLVLGPDAQTNNALSAPGKETQPLQLTAREAVRGLLATDRKIAPKQAPHDSDAAALPLLPHLEFAEWPAATAAGVANAAIRPAVPTAHQPRAPPAA